MKRNDAIKFVLIRTLGNFLLLFSLYGVAATFGPAIYYETQFQLIKIRGVNFQVTTASDAAAAAEEKQQGFEDITTLDKIKKEEEPSGGPGFGDILAGEKEQILIPSDTSFSITIPKIGASAKVYPNIDPENSSEFVPVLQKGIAHAKGSVFPGFAGNVYLFAHSTDNWWNVGRYNAIFYLLKNLTKGDSVVIFFEDKRYDYEVDEVLVVDARDTQFIARPQVGEEKLVLQTCWPPGTTWKRLVVTANPK